MLTLKKTIEILAHLQHHTNAKANPDEWDAIKLGIEAVRRCKTLAENSPLWSAKPLPGESQGGKE